MWCVQFVFILVEALTAGSLFTCSLFLLLLSSLKLEYDKLLSEKEQVQRHYVMVSERVSEPIFL